MIYDKEPLLEAPEQTVLPTAPSQQFAAAQSIDYRLHKIQQRRKEHKRVGIRIGSCKQHFDACKDQQSFDYVADKKKLTYSGKFHDQVFEEWNAEHPILTANVSHVLDEVDGVVDGISCMLGR